MTADPIPRGDDPTTGAVTAVSVTSERGVRIAAVVIAFVWHLVINLPAIVVGWSGYRHPWVAGTGWLVVAVVGLVATAHLFRGTRLPVWPAVAVLLLVHAAVFAAVPPTRFFSGANWSWGTLGWFAVLVLWGRPVSRLIAVLAAGAAIALAAVLGAGPGGAADVSRWVMFVYGTTVLQVALAVAAGALGTLAGSTAATAAARAAVQAEREAADRALRERRERLSGISRTAGALLAELADGRADPADPAVQRRCALEASRLRRLIAESDDVPDPLLHELRACVDIAERRGVPVEFVAVGDPPELPVRIRRRLAEPLATALANARDWARLTVVAQPDEVAVSLVAPTVGGANGRDPTPPGGGVGTPPPDDLIEQFHEQDEDMTWTQTRWRAR
ncbi:hypothetical protein [Micromonospora zhanjiangensis]|uniref:Signal transduction histidine kinase n=1 Tax=Micromonospora zhanjiangensis TaxID=1522057 RepID=A0ABV8KLW5_9ACTN